MKQKRQRRRPMSFRSIAVRVICLTLALWICAMSLLTWAVAEDMYRQVDALAHRLGSNSRFFIENRTEGSSEGMYMVHSLADPYFSYLKPLLPIVAPQTPRHYTSRDWFWDKFDILYGYEAAMIHQDAEGNILVGNGNYLTMSYTTDNRWYAGNIDATGQCYVVLDELEGGMEALGRYTSPLPGISLSFGNHLYRLEGWFDRDRFYPVLVEQCAPPYDPSMSTRSEEIRRIYNNLDIRMDSLKWTTVLEAKKPDNRETETIFAWSFGGTEVQKNAFTANGKTYASLSELAAAPYWERSDCVKHDLMESIIIHTTSSESGSTTVAFRCWPLEYAMRRMIPAYLVSLTVIGLALWLILWKIYRKLTSPLLDIATATATGREITPSDGWWEPYQIQKYLCETRQTLTDTNVRLKQTETALEYAHHAEENRKQLISNLTHELKTPLAIIHSYAEGLLEGIAEEKKEQYLSVILEQSERMDALVLQMLDLSRLEAGKVRLTMEPVALLKLTQTITDRFAPLLAEKKLTLRYDMVEDLTVPADEARMEQVITNLVSNAVKYSPPGGTIWLNLYLFSGQVHFFIGNTAPHLSDEALEKVWDSFYRADPSRTEPGTGLGLALVKGIVSLHRGECTVRNTSAEGQSAVEFGFTLPVH